MALRVYKLGSFEEFQTFLQGGIVGGTDLANKKLYLHGKTLIFTSPSAETVTFAASPASAQVPIMLKEVIAQIAAQSVVKAKYAGGKLHLLHDLSAPTSKVTISGGTALGDLGLGAGSGTLYGPPDGSAPRLVTFEPSSNGDGSFIVVTQDS